MNKKWIKEIEIVKVLYMKYDKSKEYCKNNYFISIIIKIMYNYIFL